MKYTLLVTQNCNLACSYCYIDQRKARMSLSTAEQIVDFAYEHTPPTEKVEVGFFGGEPLLEFPLIRDITEYMTGHPSFEEARIVPSVVSNGTIFSTEIADFINSYGVTFGISCDGPPDVQDRFRRRHDGRPTSSLVETTIRDALASLQAVMVNAVYGPETFRELPRTVEYFSGLGVRHIYLNPDFSASWEADDVAVLREVYRELGRQYVRFYRDEDPHFISLIDSKICVILRGGYHPLERCRMGWGELAFTPEGNIYPCERLVGDGLNGHAIGNIRTGIQADGMQAYCDPSGSTNPQCTTCRLRDYCMTWCGCSNYFASGKYNRVSAFQCASEKATLATAAEVVRELEGVGDGTLLLHHAGGRPLLNSVWPGGSGHHRSESDSARTPGRA